MKLTFKGAKEKALEVYCVTFSSVSRKLSSAIVLKHWEELLVFLLLIKQLSNVWVHFKCPELPQKT